MRKIKHTFIMSINALVGVLMVLITTDVQAQKAIGRPMSWKEMNKVEGSDKGTFTARAGLEPYFYIQGVGGRLARTDWVKLDAAMQKDFATLMYSDLLNEQPDPRDYVKTGEHAVMLQPLDVQYFIKLRPADGVQPYLVKAKKKDKNAFVWWAVGLRGDGLLYNREKIENIDELREGMLLYEIPRPVQAMKEGVKGRVALAKKPGQKIKIRLQQADIAKLE